MPTFIVTNNLTVRGWSGPYIPPIDGVMLTESGQFLTTETNDLISY